MNFILMEISYLKITKKLLFLDSQIDKKLPIESTEVINNKSFFKKHKLIEKYFSKLYGKMRLEELKSKAGICFSFELPEKVEKQLYDFGKIVIENKDFKLKQEVDEIYNLPFFRQYKNIIVLSTAIWLVKDSCVQENNTYFITQSGYQNRISIEMPYTLANREHKTIELTGKELKEVEQNYFLLYSIMTKPLPVTPTVIHHSFRASTIENDKLDRSKESSFVRALINLQNARRSGQLSVKIDFYMQVLQCIYALEGMKSTKIEKTLQEVTKNLLDLTVQEQTFLANALLLSSNSTEDEIENENKSIFNTIKKAFRIRSKQSHGNKVNYSAVDIENTSIMVDEYVRRVLKNVLSRPELDYNTKEEAKKVSKYFINLGKDS